MSNPNKVHQDLCQLDKGLVTPLIELKRKLISSIFMQNFNCSSSIQKIIEKIEDKKSKVIYIFLRGRPLMMSDIRVDRGVQDSPQNRTL